MKACLRASVLRASVDFVATLTDNQTEAFKASSRRIHHSLTRNMPACVEERQGIPLSFSQLEALPFVEDEAFYPIKPNSGRDARVRVSWRKEGASLHFSFEIANDSEALPVMDACGYAKPLGSNLDVASIGRTAEVQRCMIEHGFEPKNKNMVVCQTYPQVTGCSLTAPPSGRR